MNGKDREEIFKAINAVSNKVNDYTQRLDALYSEITKSNTDDISDLYDYVADSIYNDCLTDLGLSEEESEVN